MSQSPTRRCRANEAGSVAQTVTRRSVIAAGSACLAGCVTSHRPAQACALTVPEAWSGSVIAREGERQATSVRGLVHADGPPVSLETRFNILSLGKMMTGVLMGQLFEGGHLRFTDPVRAHLPDLPEHIGSLTVGMLLDHTSGLGNYIEAWNFAAIAAARSATRLLPLVLAGSHTEPGPIVYCNSGYLLAAAVIERVTGQTYADILATRVFRRCGMRGAGLAVQDTDALPDLARSARAAGQTVAAILPGGPAGGAFMSAQDLMRFADALLAGRLVSPAVLAVIAGIQAERPGAPADGLRRGWGYGFGVTGEGPGRSIGHTGGLPGLSAACRMNLGIGRRVVALSHQDMVDAAQVSRDIMMQTGLCRPTLTTGENPA